MRKLTIKDGPSSPRTARVRWRQALPYATRSSSPRYPSPATSAASARARRQQRHDQGGLVRELQAQDTDANPPEAEAMPAPSNLSRAFIAVASKPEDARRLATRGGSPRTVRPRQSRCLLSWSRWPRRALSSASGIAPAPSRSLPRQMSHGVTVRRSASAGSAARPWVRRGAAGAGIERGEAPAATRRWQAAHRG